MRWAGGSPASFLPKSVWVTKQSKRFRAVVILKPWYSKMDDYIKLQASWIEEWNTIHGYRQ